jgi:cellulose synthase/poly-beta-1,6-N-acetylglucosamine synthase-like glycosyltransferase
MCVHAICKNNGLKYIIFINDLKMIPLELDIHMCFHVMHTWLLPLQNDLWKKILIYMLNYVLWCMMLIIIYIFDKTHNTQLGYDYNYVNLITYLHHVEKLHMLNVKWWTLIFHIIS